VAQVAPPQVDRAIAFMLESGAMSRTFFFGFLYFLCLLAEGTG
jgi:hypothetical protein